MDHVDTITVVGAIGAVLSVICIGIRLYARHMKKAGFSWDDRFIVLSGFALVAMTITAITAAKSINPDGLNLAWNQETNFELTEKDIQYNKLNFTMTFLYFTVVSTTKLSILLMYNRLFSVSSTFRRQVFFLTLLTGAFWIGTTVSTFLSCIPLRHIWVSGYADPRYCLNLNLYWLGCGVAESVIDLLILPMPIRMVYKLNLSPGRKIAVAGIFLLGVFVIVSGVIKVSLSYVPGGRIPDSGRTSIWTFVHICTGIICACLPVCWPEFLHIGRTKWSGIAPVSFIRGYWFKFSGWSRIRRSRGAPSPYIAADESSIEQHTFDTLWNRNPEGYPLATYDPGVRRPECSLKESQGSHMIHGQQDATLKKSVGKTSSPAVTMQTIATT